MHTKHPLPRRPKKSGAMEHTAPALTFVVQFDPTRKAGATHKEAAAHIETLESHVARPEGIIHVMLIEIENGTIQETAAEIRATLPKLDEQTH